MMGLGFWKISLVKLSWSIVLLFCALPCHAQSYLKVFVKCENPLKILNSRLEVEILDSQGRVLKKVSTWKNSLKNGCIYSYTVGLPTGLKSGGPRRLGVRVKEFYHNEDFCYLFEVGSDELVRDPVTVDIDSVDSFKGYTAGSYLRGNHSLVIKRTLSKDQMVIEIQPRRLGEEIGSLSRDNKAGDAVGLLAYFEERAYRGIQKMTYVTRANGKSRTGKHKYINIINALNTVGQSQQKKWSSHLKVAADVYDKFFRPYRDDGKSPQGYLQGLAFKEDGKKISPWLK